MSAPVEPPKCVFCEAPVPDGVRCPACDRAQPKDRVGTVLVGKYRIDRVLGRGGFGVVYLATHVALESQVAIKFLLSEWATHGELRARFHREARVLTRLQHPSIVAALDFGEDEGDLYLVMELVRGTQLAGLVARDPDPMPPPRAAKIAIEILQVLELAHERGIVHRDLKPENVMLVDAGDGTERVKVLDFGLALADDAQRSARLTATSTVHGTPYYMSPEQCRGRDVGPETDVYAVGCILFEMLAGEPPFMGDDFAALMAQQLFVEPPPIVERGYQRAAPPELEALARWALQKKAADRPTASQLRVALQEALAGTDTVSRASRDAVARAKVGALSRDERALPAAPEPYQPTAHGLPESRVSIPGEAAPRVVLWGFSGKQVESLRSALAVQGIDAVAWGVDEPPPERIAGRPVSAIVVHGDAQATDRTRRTRAPDSSSAIVAKLPLLVAGLDDADAVPGLIRAGASDVAMNDVGDEQVCRKVWRLVRRKR